MFVLRLDIITLAKTRRGRSRGGAVWVPATPKKKKKSGEG